MAEPQERCCAARQSRLRRREEEKGKRVRHPPSAGASLAGSEGCATDSRPLSGGSLFPVTLPGRVSAVKEKATGCAKNARFRYNDGQIPHEPEIRELTQQNDESGEVNAKANRANDPESDTITVSCGTLCDAEQEHSGKQAESHPSEWDDDVRNDTNEHNQRYSCQPCQCQPEVQRSPSN